ncbi:MAG: S-layer homology domain-containing protein [Clostridia bacterium]
MKGSKVLLGLLASITVSGTLPLSSYAGTSFSDIDGSYAKDAITKLAEQGILNGRGDGSFNPTGNISRQDFAIILAKAMNLEVTQPPAMATFSDVPNNHYAFAYIEAAAKAGLISGMGGGTFGTGGALSRQDMAVLFARALGMSGTGPTTPSNNLPFSDAAQIADYAKDAVALAISMGLINGNPDGTFNPQGLADRQAVATVAEKFLNVTDTKNQNNPTPSTNPPGGTSTGGASSGTGGGSGGGSGIGSGSDSRADNPPPKPQNHAPTVAKQIADVSMTAGDKAMNISLDGVFADADGDSLAYTATSADTSKATVTVQNGSVQVTPLSEGTVSITVTALDGKGGTASASFKATVKPKPPENHAPTVNNPVPAQTVTVGEASKVLDISDVFADQDGDALSLAVSSSDSRKLKTSLSSNRLTLEPLAEGTATVVMVARDGRGGEVSSSFEVTVKAPVVIPNHQPVVQRTLSDQFLLTGSSPTSIGLAGVFLDEDGDALTLSAVSSDSSKITVAMTGTGLQLTPISDGAATITVTADDGKGGTVSTSFTATGYTPLPPSNHPPKVSYPVGQLIYTVGNPPVAFDLCEIFTDADGDELSFTAVSNNPDAVAVTMESYGLLLISPLQEGSAKITLTARDGKGGNTSYSFDVMVRAAQTVNHDPKVLLPNGMRIVILNTDQEVDLSEIFTDDDGDTLSFQAVVQDDTVITTNVTGSTLTITPHLVGETTITLTADDGKGGTAATTTLTITVIEGAAG